MSEETITHYLPGTYVFQNTAPRSYTFACNSKMALKINADGTIEIGEGLKPDEAGKQAIEAMRYQLGFMLKQARADAYEDAAQIADTGMLVPPDGGSPTEDECAVAERIAAAIRARKDQP